MPSPTPSQRSAASQLESNVEKLVIIYVVTGRNQSKEIRFTLKADDSIDKYRVGAISKSTTIHVGIDLKPRVKLWKSLMKGLGGKRLFFDKSVIRYDIKPLFTNIPSVHLFLLQENVKRFARILGFWVMTFPFF